MKTQLVVEIAQLALSLAGIDGGGRLQHDAAIARGLLEIVWKGVQAYELYAGQPLDPSLIKPEKPI